MALVGSKNIVTQKKFKMVEFENINNWKPIKPSKEKFNKTMKSQIF